MQKLKLLSIFLLFHISIFADDIWFISPNSMQAIQYGQPLTIQVQPPYNGKAKVKVYLKSESGWERIVWRGTLTPQNNYTTIIDTKKFRPGAYELKASYWIGFEKFDSDIDIWINNSNTQSYEQYFPYQDD